MTDYRATKVDGTSYVRANEVFINNSFGRAPSILFNEEMVLNIGGQVIRQPYAAPLPAMPLLETFGESNAPFQLLDPATGAVIGTATNADLHVLLYSKYLHLTEARDRSLEQVAQQQLLQQQADAEAQAAALAAAQADAAQ
ncbi:hypothetical protein [Undibacterium rugosum]|uniref:hypothetical protein n=1 Tax=Undibacterium rugosum TaxID=2762291 RepID=UPI001B83839D|nr:hypothetical protein [Undibacterium rugosum]MBR7777378.1 hypothetical protein [Undibacterium rugosum]